MNIVLEEACRAPPHDGDHELRKFITNKLVESALAGNTTLGELTDIARSALAEVTKKPA